MSIILDPSYTWTDNLNNKWPICNAKFVYGFFNSTSFTGSPWKALSINSSFTGNNKLVSLTLNSNNTGLNFAVDGIYRLRTTLTFSGFPDTTIENINFVLSTIDISGAAWSTTNNNYCTTNLTSNESISTSSTSKIISFGYLYASNSDLVVFNTTTPFNGVQFQIYATVPSANTYTSSGLSVVENI